MAQPIDLTRLAPSKPAIYYPESDRQPMGETDAHITVILYLRQALRYFFRQAEQVYVAANMFFYYREGEPDARCAPDVFVVKGVPKFDRRTYKLWEEFVSPCAVFEITSPSTRVTDSGHKKGLYEALKVEEYFLFDPLGEYLKPSLQGFRLQAGKYEPLALSPEGTLLSQALGLILKPEGGLLRVIDPTTGESLPTLDEALEQTETALKRAQVEAERAQAEAERADAAEAEVNRLRAELARLRGELNQDG